MQPTRTRWYRRAALVSGVLGLSILSVGIFGSLADAKPDDKGNACVTKGDDTDSPPAGCDKSRPGGHSQGKVCPENHPNGKRVPAVDKGLSPDRPNGNAHGGTEVVCAEVVTTTTAPATTTTTAGVTTTTSAAGTTTTTAVAVSAAAPSAGAAAPTAVLGVTEEQPTGAAAPEAVPEELAFTGTSVTSSPWLLALGLVLVVVGSVCFLAPARRVEARVPGRRT